MRLVLVCRNEHHQVWSNGIDTIWERPQRFPMTVQSPTTVVRSVCTLGIVTMVLVVPFYLGARIFKIQYTNDYMISPTDVM